MRTQGDTGVRLGQESGERTWNGSHPTWKNYFVAIGSYVMWCSSGVGSWTSSVQLIYAALRPRPVSRTASLTHASVKFVSSQTSVPRTFREWSSFHMKKSDRQVALHFSGTSSAPWRHECSVACIKSSDRLPCFLKFSTLDWCDASRRSASEDPLSTFHVCVWIFCSVYRKIKHRKCLFLTWQQVAEWSPWWWTEQLRVSSVWCIPASQQLAFCFQFFCTIESQNPWTSFNFPLNNSGRSN